MKTVKEWLQQLDEPYRSQALKNMYDQTSVEHPLVSEKRVSSIYDAISHAFLWDITPEGFDYWSKIYNRYERK